MTLRDQIKKKNTKATEHCTGYRASRARRWESVITTVALDGHSCFLPWMITTIYCRGWSQLFTALDDHNYLPPWMITTIYCLGWSQLFTALDDHNYLMPWMITTVCCPGWSQLLLPWKLTVVFQLGWTKLFTDNFPNLGQSAAPCPHKHCIWTNTHQNLPPGTTQIWGLIVK